MTAVRLDVRVFQCGSLVAISFASRWTGYRNCGQKHEDQWNEAQFLQLIPSFCIYGTEKKHRKCGSAVMNGAEWDLRSHVEVPFSSARITPCCCHLEIQRDDRSSFVNAGRLIRNMTSRWSQKVRVYIYIYLLLIIVNWFDWCIYCIYICIYVYIYT